tara:strand:+ start:2447 stop:3319 length:873 start_codon:yes stop_codon:yes gene_type:complete
MARIIKTVTSEGGSSTGGSGVTLPQVCTAVCNVICKSIIGTAGTSMLPRCQSKEGWELICNCDHWSECYSSTLEWDLDTANYRAFRWCMRGITHCGCCDTQFCMYFIDSSSACQGGQYYRHYDIRGNKPWPVGSCCCWELHQPDCICFCWYCCGTNCSMPQSMSWEIGTSVAKSNCMSGNNSSGGLCYDICYGHRWPACDFSNCWGGSNRIKGWTWCHPVVWNEEQNSGSYLKSLRIKNNYGWIPTDTASATWQSRWGNQPQGQPCWSIYGIPCTRPDIAGSNVQTTSFA